MHLNQDEALRTLFTGKTDSVLLFNIGCSPNNISISYDLLNNPQKSFTFYNHQAWLGGMINQPLGSIMSGNTHVLCVILTPFGLYHLLKESSTSVLNAGYSLETLGLQVHFEYLIDKLQQTQSNTHALQLVENHLLHYFNHLDIPFSVKDMSRVINYITERNGIVQVKQLEDKFGISSRWLEKQFVAQVGVSPKEFARIKRFTAILGQATMSPRKVTKTASAVSWGTLLNEFGYHDHSHLIKDFKQFTGQTPAQYLKNTPHGINNIFLKSLG